MIGLDFQNFCSNKMIHQTAIETYLDSFDDNIVQIESVFVGIYFFLNFINFLKKYFLIA